MKIRDELIAMIGEAKPVSAPVLETSNLYANLGFDSLAFVRLLLKIEENYLIAFDLIEMGTCLEVGRLTALVEKKVKESKHDSALINKPGKPRENRGHSE